MRRIPSYLKDEHMKLYEWSGAGTGIAFSMPAKSKRTHPWHASYAVLASLTSLLILNGCDKQGTAEQASEQVGQAIDDMKPQPLYQDPASLPVPAEAAAPATEPEQPAEQSVQPDQDLSKP